MRPANSRHGGRSRCSSAVGAVGSWRWSIHCSGGHSLLPNLPLSARLQLVDTVPLRWVELPANAWGSWKKRLNANSLHCWNQTIQISSCRCVTHCLVCPVSTGSVRGSRLAGHFAVLFSLNPKPADGTLNLTGSGQVQVHARLRV